MAKIDVSEVLDDPDFQDNITVIRRASVVGTNGRNAIVEIPSIIMAVVQAGSSETLKRLPDYAALSDTLTVYARYKFIAYSDGQYSDIVLWNGRRYGVQVVSDHTNWGDGYARADCLIEGGGNGN